MLRSVGLGTLLALGVGIAGCAAAGTDLAEQASDSMDAVTAEAALVVASMDGITASTTPEEAANAAAANAGAFWTEGCFTYLIDGASITYELTECGGPFGLARVNGSVTVTYRATTSSYGFDVTTSNLTIGDATVSYMLSADVATDARNVRVTSSGSATGRRGHAVTHEGTYDLRWNGSSECAGLDGSWTTTVGARTFTTQVAGWQRCGDGCPAAGGSISYTGPVASVIVTYDGSSEASFTNAEGGSGTIPLFCE